MTTKDLWRQRVKAWHSSGMPSDEFCAGRGFSASLLRHWAWRLGMKRGRWPVQGRGAEVRLAKVIATPAYLVSSPSGPRSAVRIAIGCANVDVQPGVDAATLATVVTVLSQHLGPKENAS